jgi:arylsulfatase A-like enzyme
MNLDLNNAAMSNSKSTQSLTVVTNILYLAAWFALATGFGDVLMLGLRKFFFQQVINRGLDVIWMAPLAYVPLFVIPGLSLSLLSRWIPTLGSFTIYIFTFTVIAFFSVLLTFPEVHLIAAVLLSAGLAVQATRQIVRRISGFQVIVRRTLGPMILLIICLAVIVQGSRWTAEQRALAHLPTPGPQSVNVLVIVLDTVRAQNLSLYGYARPTTPHLEQWAKTGVVFQRAFSTAPWTLPSHASIFTGRWPHELSAEWFTPLDGSYPTLAEVLAAHGYLTAGFVANIHPFLTSEYGLGRGFAHYDDYPLTVGQLFSSSSLFRKIAESSKLRSLVGYYDLIPRKNAEDINEAFLSWLSRIEKRPFFAFLNYFDAHDPYLPPSPFDAKFGPNRSRTHPQRFFRKVLPDEQQAWLDAYDGTIAYLDHNLDHLLRSLGERDVLKNTVVIITSDHGEEFGEHGVFGHANSVYVQGLHVPLLILYPSHVPSGERIHHPVSLRDLPATVLDLIKLDPAVSFPGKSLSRFWSGSTTTTRMEGEPVPSEVSVSGNSLLPSWYPITKGSMRSLVIDHHHYIENGDGTQELYDFEKDSFEQRNLAQSTEGRQLLPRFRTRLRHVLRPRPATPGITTAGVSSIAGNPETVSSRNEARPSSQLSPEGDIKLGRRLGSDR